MSDKAILIDGMNLCHKHYHIRKHDKKFMINDKFVGLFDGFLGTLQHIRRVYEGYRVYVLWDSKSRKRSVLYPEYKKKKYKPEEAEQKEKERELIYKSVEELKEMISFDGIYQIWADGYEADDIAAHFVRKYKNYDDIVLWTSDSDWSQLVCDNTRWVDTSQKMLTPLRYLDVKRKYGFPPECLTVYKALTGDVSDNIKGIPRFPKKIATQLCNRTSSIEGLFYDRSILLDIPDKWKLSIKDYASDLRRNFQLVSLYDNLETIKVKMGVINKERLNDILKSYGMVKPNSNGMTKVQTFMIERKKKADAAKKQTEKITIEDDEDY